MDIMLVEDLLFDWKAIYMAELASLHSHHIFGKINLKMVSCYNTNGAQRV